MSNFLKLVGAQLRTVRKARGLTQEELAEKTGKIGVGKSRISDIERGEANITLETLEMLMNALEIHPNELFNFQRLATKTDFEEKSYMLDLHLSILRDRDLDEVKYVMSTTKDFLDTVDAKMKK
ncbi:helix-turn-helix domain-containing protein [Psychrobacillus soli]|uniref:Helix-turn-helix transcriptional regulator n=1 Tax=Psychrobacillus soli TaxID=1543965 RepID=A0A544TDB2_9BACI|nr:helix-turn-helix transcriptional regulator [Psychrobacillus soli]TQR15425.1 helix-turn-helix transcriptional regulator [Psychrobacillus soli]